MDIAQALRLAQKETGWTSTQLGAAAGASEAAARQWLSGRATPVGDKLELLRAKMPALRRILDAQSAAIRVNECELPNAA